MQEGCDTCRQGLEVLKCPSTNKKGSQWHCWHTSRARWFRTAGKSMGDSTWGTLQRRVSDICQRGFLLPPAPHQLRRDSQQEGLGDKGLNPDLARLMSVLV